MKWSARSAADTCKKILSYLPNKMKILRKLLDRANFQANGFVFVNRMFISSTLYERLIFRKSKSVLQKHVYEEMHWNPVAGFASHRQLSFCFKGVWNKGYLTLCFNHPSTGDPSITNGPSYKTCTVMGVP